MSRTNRSGFSALAAAALLAATSGCSSTVARREPAPAAGRQGGAWDTVLPGPKLALAGSGPEYSRRDEALQWESPESTLTRALGSPYGPPDLVRSRRLYMPQNPFGYIYYLDVYGGPRR